MYLAIFVVLSGIVIACVIEKDLMQRSGGIDISRFVFLAVMCIIIMSLSTATLGAYHDSYMVKTTEKGYSSYNNRSDEKEIQNIRFLESLRIDPLYQELMEDCKRDANR